jgi:hypothetical protein
LDGKIDWNPDSVCAVALELRPGRPSFGCGDGTAKDIPVNRVCDFGPVQDIDPDRGMLRHAKSGFG